MAADAPAPAPSPAVASAAAGPRIFAAALAHGDDIRPTIAAAKAHVILPEVIETLQKGRLVADGRIHRLVSMSNLKYDAIVGSGTEIVERVNIPDELIPADARVEMNATVAAGYFSPGPAPDPGQLKNTKGRRLDR